MEESRVIVAGTLNTDITFRCERMARPGELVTCSDVRIGPGGKSANIARMAAILLGPRSVAMIARTCEDAYGLWRTPFDALERAGVDTRFIQRDRSPDTLPGIAGICVDDGGENSIYFAPGASASFSTTDVDDAQELFTERSRVFAVTFEMPVATATYALRLAREHQLRTVIDPGGMTTQNEYLSLLSGAFLIKPNLQETEQLTGILVQTFADARRAATRILERDVTAVLITAGRAGGYLFTDTIAEHLPAADCSFAGARDSTGCGDQVTATLCAFLANDQPLLDSARAALLAGTLQYQRAGIVPVTLPELLQEL